MSANPPTLSIQERDLDLKRLNAALEPVLETASRFTELPVIAFSASGAFIGHSRDAGQACALIRHGAHLEPSPRGDWTCPVTSCSHHPSFRALRIEAGDCRALLAHCERVDRLGLLSDLAKALVESHRDCTSLLGELSRIYEEINWLYGLGDVLDKEIDQNKTLAAIFRHVQQVLSVGDAEVWAPDPEINAYRCLVRYEDSDVVRNLETVPRTPESDGVLQRMGIRVIREEARQLGPEGQALLALTKYLGLPAVALPLKAKSRFLGVLLFRLKSRDRVLNAAQLKLLTAISRQTSLCVQVHTLVEELRANEGLRREVEIAREIQHGLFPQVIPTSDKYDLYGGCVTAARVSGDYYDLYQRDDTLGILIADVSGHNVASGLIAMSFRCSFRHFLADAKPIGEIFSHVNRALYDELHLSGHFLSAFFGTYSTADHKLRYVNAGHNHPFVLQRRTGKLIDLSESGLLIGVLQETEHPVGELELQSGDLLIIYTDGLVEAENQHSQIFGVDRVKEAVRRYRDKSAKQLYHFLLKDMYVFQDEYFNKDDVTIIVLKIK